MAESTANQNLTSEPTSTRRPSQGKSDALKEIEDWAWKGRSGPCLNGRGSGKLADNITEERMLQSRIWDLSKERYKFLSQSHYERRTFVDKQLRKSAVFKELLKDVDLKKKMLPEGAPSFDERPPLTRRSSTLGRMMTNTAMKDVQSRTDSGLKKVPPARPRPQTVPANTVSRQGESRVMFKTERPLVLPNCQSDLLKTPMVPDGRHGDEQLTERLRIGSTKSTPANMRHVTFGTMGSRKVVSHWKKVTFRKDKQLLQSKPTEDQRYRLLENCLCENLKNVQHPSKQVSVLIQNNASLHVPPRRSRDPKTRLALKLDRLLVEQGLAC